MKVKTIRIQKGLTQAQVANRTGISVTSYQRIEYGVQNPSLKTAIRIAKVLNSSVEELWGESRSD